MIHCSGRAMTLLLSGQIIGMQCATSGRAMNFETAQAKAAQNRAKMPDAHLHTGGSRTFGSHQKKMVTHQIYIVKFISIVAYFLIDFFII